MRPMAGADAAPPVDDSPRTNPPPPPGPQGGAGGPPPPGEDGRGTPNPPRNENRLDQPAPTRPPTVPRDAASWRVQDHGPVTPPAHRPAPRGSEPCGYPGRFGS